MMFSNMNLHSRIYGLGLGFRVYGLGYVRVAVAGTQDWIVERRDLKRGPGPLP